MKHEQYIICEDEIDLLNQYEGTVQKTKDPHRYDNVPIESLATLCRLKDRSNDLYIRQVAAARDVIDLIARKIGIDPENTSFWLYAPNAHGSSPILDRIEDWFSRSGEKTQIKRRVQELEQENFLLRSLINK